jgi:hypothetical protein
VPGSDIVMGYKDLNSTECAEGCVTDYHTLQYAMPIKDDVQNVEKVAVTLSTYNINIFILFRKLIANSNFLDLLTLIHDFNINVCFSYRTFGHRVPQAVE